MIDGFFPGCWSSLCHPERSPVILSEAKDLSCVAQAKDFARILEMISNQRMA